MSLVAIENDRLPSGLYVGMVHLRDYSLHHLAIEAACVRCWHASIVNRVALIERYGELRAFDSRGLRDLARHLSCIRCGALAPSLSFVIESG
jgi:hypothetical protein